MEVSASRSTKTEKQDPTGCKKRTPPDVKETKSSGGRSNRLHLKDAISGLIYLVDSGADVSVVPRPKDWEGKPLNFKLYAANQTPINVYKQELRSVCFAPDKVLNGRFLVADVPYAILISDVLAYYHLLPDLTKQTLTDSNGKIFGRGELLPINSAWISLINDSDPVSKILREFPMVIGVSEPKANPKHKVFHYIDTHGPPIAQKARRLSGKKLKAARREFQKLCILGLARPSKSPWATPIHLVENGDGFRIVGDYRRLNRSTKPDRYPIKRLTDFT